MRPPRTVTLGQNIELDNEPFTIVGYGNGSFRVRNDITCEYEVVHHIDLSRRLPPGVTLETDATPKTPVAVNEVEERLSEDARTLIPHLQELLDGTPAIGETLRPQYALHIPKTQRFDAKVKELSDDYGIEMPVVTLRRKLKRFSEEGVTGLIDQRVGRSEGPLSRTDKDVKAAMAEILHSYRGRSTVTYTAIRAELAVALMDRFPDPATRPKTPSLSTVERLTKFMSGSQDPTTLAKSRQTAALSPTTQHRPRLVFAPGDEAQMDATELDLLVRMPSGKVARPHLTILVDKRTRGIIGHNLTESNPTGLDHVGLLARTIVPRKLRPWHSDYAAYDLPQMKWSTHLTPEQLALFDSFRPYIFPIRILIDNGSDFRSKSFKAACDRHGISLTEAPVHAPAAKAHVERTFTTIKTKFVQHLPGFTGGDVLRRGDKVHEENLLELSEVAELFDRWVSVVYQNREHSELVDEYRPGHYHSPNSMYAAAVELSGHFVVAFEEEDYMSMLPTDERTVQADGVEFNGRMYDSPHLGPLRDRKRTSGSSRQVKVSYDPADGERVWVRSPIDGGWVECVWTGKRGRTRPFEKSLQFAAHHESLTATTFDNHAADVAVVQWRNELTVAAAARKEALKTKTGSKAAKAASAVVEDIIARVLTPDEDAANDFMNYVSVESF